MTQKSKQKLSLRKGDLVQVVAGKDKGKQGKITQIYTEKFRVVVEGVNIATKHVKPSQQNPGGGVQKKERPLHISNVMFVDPKSGKPTRLGKKQTQSKDGKTSWVRFAKNSGTEITQTAEKK